MHALRRIVAVVTQLLMLQVVILSGGAVCPMTSGAAMAHGAHDRAGGAIVPAHASAPGASVGAPAAPAHHATQDCPRCEQPCAPGGCSGGASAVSPAPESGTRALRVRVDDGVPGAEQARPASVSPAPEPPPPRA